MDRTRLFQIVALVQAVRWNVLMHRGRRYPYLPVYWACPAWFYPGRLPWKFVIDGPGAASGAWSGVGPLASLVSDAGIPDSTGDSASYAFHVGFMPGGYIVTISLYRGGIFPHFSAEWYASLVSGLGAAATATATQAYPQTAVDLPAFDSAEVAGSGIPCEAPAYHLRPATYGEGGSPWLY